uniref:Uncharacterized protein n=1 Tax=Arundo donax TaxID=35708 RepID=A0A0A9HI24_ARUDO
MRCSNQTEVSFSLTRFPKGSVIHHDKQDHDNLVIYTILVDLLTVNSLPKAHNMEVTKDDKTSHLCKQGD